MFRFAAIQPLMLIGICLLLFTMQDLLRGAAGGVVPHASLIAFAIHDHMFQKCSALSKQRTLGVTCTFDLVLTGFHFLSNCVSHVGSANRLRTEPTQRVVTQPDRIHLLTTRSCHAWLPGKYHVPGSTSTHTQSLCMRSPLETEKCYRHALLRSSV